MTAADEVRANNKRYADAFPRLLPLPASRHLAVVARMDRRLNVFALLGLREGEAYVIRNAGGVITDDVIRSLAISQRLLGTRDLLRRRASGYAMALGHAWPGLSALTKVPSADDADGKRSGSERRLLGESYDNGCCILQVDGRGRPRIPRDGGPS